MTQLEKIAMRSFNHYIEMADGNMREARALFAEWVGETSPLIGESSKQSWTMLIVAIDWCFQDAGYTCSP